MVVEASITSFRHPACLSLSLSRRGAVTGFILLVNLLALMFWKREAGYKYGWSGMGRAQDRGWGSLMKTNIHWILDFLTLQIVELTLESHEELYDWHDRGHCRANELWSCMAQLPSTYLRQSATDFGCSVNGIVSLYFSLILHFTEEWLMSVMTWLDWDVSPKLYTIWLVCVHICNLSGSDQTFIL